MGGAEDLQNSWVNGIFVCWKHPGMSFTWQISFFLIVFERMEFLRRQFNSGFSHQYIAGLTSYILEKTRLFIHNLDHYANTGEEFLLDSFFFPFTFDIIGM